MASKTPSQENGKDLSGCCTEKYVNSMILAKTPRFSQWQEADWSLPKISVNQARYEVIDYSQVPYSHSWTAVTFLTNPPQNLKSWFAVTYPFEGFVWLASLLAFLLYCPLFCLVLHPKQKVSIVTAMSWMLNMLTGRGEEKIKQLPNKCIMDEVFSSQV